MVIGKSYLLEAPLRINAPYFEYKTFNLNKPKAFILYLDLKGKKHYINNKVVLFFLKG